MVAHEHHHHHHGPDHDHHHHEHNHGHHHDHGHHHHHHEHEHRQQRTIQLEQDILSHNNLLAERIRGYLEAKNIIAFNLVSSPGSGKTALLERTIKDIGKERPIYVIEGDQQTTNDAQRILDSGAKVIQVNTGTGCHLEADMVFNAIKKLQPEEGSILMIENVGNLVCPALFDLGETQRIVIMSTTEGEDKPLKYPHMFTSSDVCIINKTDLLPYLDFDLEKARQYIQQVKPDMAIIEVSATKGDGLTDWYDWLQAQTLQITWLWQRLTSISKGVCKG